MKNTTKFLSIFGWIFFIAGVIAAATSIIMLAIGEFYEYDSELVAFIVALLGSCLISSWGVLLFGVKNIVDK